MKFAHGLYRAASDVPEYRTLYVFYKGMKKMLKLLLPREGCVGEHVPEPKPAARFISQLLTQMVLLDGFRQARQEACRDRLAALLAQASAAQSDVERRGASDFLSEFHEEAALLFQWGILAHTSFCKLLKKHRKHIGELVESPRLSAILAGSWFSQELAELIRRAEHAMYELQGTLPDMRTLASSAAPHYNDLLQNAVGKSTALLSLPLHPVDPAPGDANAAGWLRGGRQGRSAALFSGADKVRGMCPAADAAWQRGILLPGNRGPCMDPLGGCSGCADWNWRGEGDKADDSLARSSHGSNCMRLDGPGAEHEDEHALDRRSSSDLDDDGSVPGTWAESRCSWHNCGVAC